MKTPTIEQLMSDPATYSWVKDMLRVALTKDPVDAYYGSLLVTEMLKENMDQVLGK